MTRSAIFCLLVLAAAPAFAEQQQGGDHGGQGGLIPVPAPNGGSDIKFPCEIPKGTKTGIKLVMPDVTEAEQKLVQGWLKSGVEGAIHFTFEDMKGLTRKDYLDKFPGADPLKARITIHEDGFVPGMIDSMGHLVKMQEHLDLITDAEKKIADLQKQIDMNGRNRETLENQKKKLELRREQDNQTAGQFEMLWLWGFRTNKFQEEVWKSTPRPLPDAEAEKLAKLVDTVAPTGQKDQKEYAAAVTKVQDEKVWEDHAAWKKLITAAGKAYADLATGKYKGIKRVPELTAYNDLLADPANKDKQQAFTEQMIWDGGGKDTAQRIADQYCDALKEGKELVALTNPHYFAQVRRMLMRAAGRPPILPLTFRAGGRDL